MTVPKDDPDHNFHADDAPDLSTPEWQTKFSKAPLASGPVEGNDLERAHLRISPPEPDK